ncbi:lysozyme [Pedobacter sp.]|uniref:lysozyme n=1 Tax=Pedobacter sp. TaxID=1411316 RepID=UPI003D7F68F6
MKLDSAGENFILQEEGMVLHPYQDSAGIATIGVGCTYYEDGTLVTLQDEPITEERALQLFRNLVKTYELAVGKAIHVPLTQNQFNALVSLCFNIGIAAFKQSTLVIKINTEASIAEIETWFLVWNKVGVAPILLDRRKREFQLFCTP